MISELVDLPDPAVQPLVHPLDLPEARRPMRGYWLIATLTDPPVGVCLGGLLWFATHSPVVPILVGLAVVVCGWCARKPYLEQAWSYIPNKRQDRSRLLPVSWELVSRLVFAVLLAAGLVLVAVRLSRPDVLVEAREFTFGMGAVVAVAQLGEFVGRARHGRRTTLLGLPVVLAAVGVVVGAYFVLFGGSGMVSPSWAGWGAVSMVVLWAGTIVWHRVSGRR
ncbi:MAG TPA: hypothetical protein VHF06_03505 [Pseudonocardiaceae bacterium]|jgi:hypothetical protein|nr:hypothetical protein [Pseudonocardiaceae bacterium]